MPLSAAPNHLGWVETQALCLDDDARDALLDTIVRNEVSELIISGCNRTPLPRELPTIHPGTWMPIDWTQLAGCARRFSERQSTLQSLVFLSINVMFSAIF